MSVIRITPNDVETFTLVTNPRREYVSSSSGVTGSVRVFPRQSPYEKNVEETSTFNDTKGIAVVDDRFEKYYDDTRNSAKKIRKKSPPTGDLVDVIDTYLTTVEHLNSKEPTVLDIERFTPTTRFTKRTLQKFNIKDMLMPYYRVQYSDANWAYTNYHSLNFFTTWSTTSTNLPTASVLLYPNVVDPDLPGQEGHVSGSYCLTGSFTFDFYVNPRYKKDGIDPGEFKAGTFFHLSSSYALSLVTGTLKDENGLPQGYRLQLQLSHSADYPPSKVLPGSYPHDLVFVSDDNSLIYNKWHHVVVRWGTNIINEGTGSFFVDGVNRGDFVVPSGTIMPKEFVFGGNPDVLCIGNFYEGTNVGTDSQSLFFSTENALRDGVVDLVSDPQEDPISYRFDHPLKAEVHDLVLRRYYLSDAELSSTGSRGIGADAFVKKNIAFYLPPFFVEDTTIKRYRGDHGGILQTPFFTIDGTTDDPFNVALAFGVNGHYINLENFTKDFATGLFPRHILLTGSTIDYTTDADEANNFLYTDPQIAKRNLTILPCDDGNFIPNWEVLDYERLSNKYVDPSGHPVISYINLENLVTTASLVLGKEGSIDIDKGANEEYASELVGFTPETPGTPPGPAYLSYISALTSSLGQLTDDNKFDRGIQKKMPLTIYQRTLDPSSNQVTIFNISNLYYGKRILPGSFMIRDADMSGSLGAVGITLRDDQAGNIYRADSDTDHHTKNSVGNIFYDEGIVVIKSPHLYFFGKNHYEVSFRGVYEIYTSKYEFLAGPGLLNSSSNVTYTENKDKIKPSASPTDNETFVYISGINFHDENMNVVAKAKLAQPVIKRESDKILFKVAFDW